MAVDPVKDLVVAVDINLHREMKEEGPSDRLAQRSVELEKEEKDNCLPKRVNTLM
jgi:hypothetical protein